MSKENDNVLKQIAAYRNRKSFAQWELDALCDMAIASLTLRDDGIGELAKAKLPGKNARAILPLLEELEEANAEIMEQCRLNAMGSEREAKLIAELELERKRRWEGNQISSNEHIAEVVQFKEEIRRARNEGLEDAAKVCEEERNDLNNRRLESHATGAANCLHAIRALIEKGTK